MAKLFCSCNTRSQVRGSPIYRPLPVYKFPYIEIQHRKDRALFPRDPLVLASRGSSRPSEPHSELYSTQQSKPRDSSGSNKICWVISSNCSTPIFFTHPSTPIHSAHVVHVGLPRPHVPIEASSRFPPLPATVTAREFSWRRAGTDVCWNYWERGLSFYWDGSLLGHHPGAAGCNPASRRRESQENGAYTEKSRAKTWRSKETPDHTI